MDNTALVQASSVLSDAQEAIKNLLENSHNMLYVGFNFKLTQMINQLNSVAGVTSTSQKPPQFQPVTNFFGEDIKQVKPVIETDLSPKELERKIFTEKVDNLQAEFDALSNESVLESYKIEPNVVRGLAKRAELEDYKTGEINNDFLDRIRASFKKIAEQEKAKEADDNLVG